MWIKFSDETPKDGEKIVLGFLRNGIFKTYHEVLEFHKGPINYFTNSTSNKIVCDLETANKPTHYYVIEEFEG